MDREIRINARGLSAPGPRLMVESALGGTERPELIRVVVSSQAAADDLREFLSGDGASVEIDVVGSEFHVLARFARD
jgi:TusA-related sulfurtransferase